MQPYLIVLIVLALASAGFVLGRTRALQTAGGNARLLHSRPNYYGANVFLFTAVPGLLLVAVWLIAQPLVIERSVQSLIPERAIPEGGSLSLVMSDVTRLADGLDIAVERGAMTADMAANVRADFTNVRDRLGEVGVALGSNVTGDVLGAAQSYRAMSATGRMLMSITAIALALGGLTWSVMQTRASFRARNAVEAGVKVMLIGAATVAILTTIGILFSLIFNTLEFFKLYSAADFFFGTTWSPSFSGRGGGSGGALLLEGNEILVAAGAQILAGGGGGGAGLDGMAFGQSGITQTST
ncbi:MAG: phosphate ABC transporter permease family protein, partial [Pseudomonadota bacterium]